MVKSYKQKSNISKNVDNKMLKNNKKVPAGFYVLNIPLIISKREKTIYLTVHLELAQNVC